MPNCIPDDVRLILDTGLEDNDLEALIDVADGEIAARGFSGSVWTAALKRQLSMLLTAELASLNESRIRNAGEYGDVQTSGRKYRERAEALIKNAGEPALLVWTEPTPDEDD